VAINLGYDNDSLLTTAGDLTLTRDSRHGRISGTTLGTVSDSSSYTTFGGLARYTARAGSNPIYDAQYARDALGRITTKTETIGGATDTLDYVYDAAGRLAEVHRNGTPEATYTYDANGNRIGASGVAANYDSQDRLTFLGTTSYVSTPNGERATKTSGGQATTYTYDALGNLLTVHLAGGTQVDYLVDGLSRRIGRKVNGALVQGFLYDDRGRIVAELDGTGALVSRFVYASRPSTPDYMIRAGIDYRLVSDHLGSVRLVVKSDDGTIAQRLDYDAFGSVTTDTSPGFQPFGFVGGLYDRLTKLVRFGTRDYDAEAGRWTTRDPILFAGGSTNLYVYAGNDPVNRSDITGLDDTPGTGGVCFGPLPNLNLPKPKMNDPQPAAPTPPACPTCATDAEKMQHVIDAQQVPKERRDAASSSSDSGPSVPTGVKVGPINISGSTNTPSADWRNKDPKDFFSQGSLKVDGKLDAGMGLSSSPKSPGGPDPNGPNPKPQGPQCKPALDRPDPLGCEN
jgi:RHS repeat-associated protein